MPAWQLFFRGYGPVLLRNTIFFIFQGGPDPLPPPPLWIRTWVHCIIMEVTGYNFQNNTVFLSLNDDFVLANNVDPGEMPHYTAFNLQYVAFHLSLHCLPKYSKSCLNRSLKDIQNEY